MGKDSKKVARTRKRFTVAVARAGGGSAVARSLGVTRSMISLICRGRRKPGPDTTIAIKALFGIAPEEWRDDPVIEMRPFVIRRQDGARARRPAGAE
jgi:DNA-binding transcriptional regulator YdaS (Cro superfamily)